MTKTTTTTTTTYVIPNIPIQDLVALADKMGCKVEIKLVEKDDDNEKEE